jgi:hypothetical protein
MNATRNITTKRLFASLGIAAAGAVTPALLFLGAGTAHADPCSEGDFQYSYYCSPGSSALDPSTPAFPDYGSPSYTPPSPNLWSALPGCTGGVLEALDGSC